MFSDHHDLLSRYIYDEVERVWKHFDLDGDGFVTWEGYKERQFGTVEGTLNILKQVLHL